MELARIFAAVTAILLILGGVSAASAATDLPKSYRLETHPVEQPLVLEYSFGPGERNKAALNVVNYPKKKSDLFFFHMHVNETTSKRAGEQAVRENGGTFMYLAHSSGERNMKVKIGSTSYEFDPNRIFTVKALEEKTQPKPSPADLQELKKFVEWIKRNISIALESRARRMVIALHNNTDDDIHGELLSILTEKMLLGIDNREVNVNKGWDIDDFYIATMKSTYDSLVKEYNPNISLRLEKPRDIGYLSNWMIQEKIEYINVETEIDDHGSNRRMVEIIQNLFH